MGRPNKEVRSEVWFPPLPRAFKFNVDRASKENQDQQGRWGLACFYRSSSLVFLDPMGLKDSNEAELLAIRRSLTLWVGDGQGKFIIEGDLAKAIK